jgi:HD-like signal output (HDOD) protein
MLNTSIRTKLESMQQLPAIPAVASIVLQAIDNPDSSGIVLAKLIERDPALTARVLAVANSPFYGFSRKISTVELAIVLLGLSTIKEIIISLILQGVFARVKNNVFDINSFWRYSVFCGSTARFFARRLGYRVAGEAFVAGLMHDVGVLIEAEYFTKEFLEIREHQLKWGVSFVEAELTVIQCTHADIGAWLAERWQLPPQLIESLYYHHSLDLADKEPLAHASIHSNKIAVSAQEKAFYLQQEIEQPLTALVALAELFAAELGFKKWANEPENTSPLYMPATLIEQLTSIEMKEFLGHQLEERLVEEFDAAVEFAKI